MKKSTRSMLWLVPLALFLGCQAEQAGEQMAEEEEPAAEETMEMAAATYEVEVTNPMPHTMIVYADAGGGEMELGPVPANGSAYFTISNPESMSVQLRAEDEAQTHEVSGTLQLQEGMEEAAWTIAAEESGMEEGMQEEGMEEEGMEEEGSGTDG